MKQKQMLYLFGHSGHVPSVGSVPAHGAEACGAVLGGRAGGAP